MRVAEPRGPLVGGCQQLPARAASDPRRFGNDREHGELKEPILSAANECAGNRGYQERTDTAAGTPSRRCSRDEACRRR